MKIPVADARDLADGIDIPPLLVEANEQVDQRRWVSIHQLVVQHAEKGTFWAARYEKGLTENQDIWPFEDEGDLVEFCEVEKVPVTTYIYREKGALWAGTPRLRQKMSAPTACTKCTMRGSAITAGYSQISIPQITPAVQGCQYTGKRK